MLNYNIITNVRLQKYLTCNVLSTIDHNKPQQYISETIELSIKITYKDALNFYNYKFTL